MLEANVYGCSDQLQYFMSSRAKLKAPRYDMKLWSVSLMNAAMATY